jgi:hypothetical protein
MVDLTEQTQAARYLQAMIALQMIIRGENKAKACEVSGISLWQFDEWIAKDNIAIEMLQNDIAEAERIRLTALANAQAVLLSRLVENVTMPGYADHDMQLKVLKYVDKLRNDLETKHGVHSQSDDAKEYQLHGPKTRVEDSKMAVKHEMSRSTVNIKTMPDGSVDLTLPHQSTIIDIFPELASGDEEEPSPQAATPQDDTA